MKTEEKSGETPGEYNYQWKKYCSWKALITPLKIYPPQICGVWDASLLNSIQELKMKFILDHSRSTDGENYDLLEQTVLP